tara:strand:+ start:3310 stop:3942 length:633 start_codon:yes stop_codon:yes gene_type:complete
MMPALRERAKRFNRISKEDYLSWMSSRTGVVITHVPSRERAHIDAAFEAALAVPEVVEEQPAWVDAAEEVLAQSEPEPEMQPDVPEQAPNEGDIWTGLPEAEEQPDVPEEAPTDSPFDIDTDYDSMTVAELRDVCRDRGLTIRGTKAEVVLRLRRDDEGITEETQPDDETEAPAEAAAEESSDAPAEEAAVTEEVTNNDESSEQEENIDE